MELARVRSARANDYWRRATERDRGFRLRDIRLQGKSPLDEVAFEFANGLTVVCGLNGVGKSTLLRVVEGALNGVESMAGRCRSDLLDTGTVELNLQVEGAETTVRMGENAIDGPGRAVVLDAFEACGRIIALARDPNFHDLVEVVEPRDWTDEERRLAGYVVGRTYDHLAVFEIENPTPLDEGLSEETLPYFRAAVRGVAYDSFSMGLGELAALTVLWRLSAVEPQTVLIVEEPETFLSSRSTVALLDVLARAVDERRLYALVTTHSPDVVARVPITNLRLVQRVLDSTNVTVNPPLTRAQLELALGALVGVARVIFAEDKTAQMLTVELLAYFAGLWGEGVDVQVAKDAQSVVALCKLLPASDRMNVVGVLDGDQACPALPDGAWPVLVLPGGDDPNTVLRAAALSQEREFAVQLHRDESTVATALQLVAGADVHDWFPDLAAALNVDEQAVIRAACHCWLLDSHVRASAQAFASQLANALSR